MSLVVGGVGGGGDIGLAAILVEHYGLQGRVSAVVSFARCKTGKRGVGRSVAGALVEVVPGLGLGRRAFEDKLPLVASGAWISRWSKKRPSTPPRLSRIYRALRRTARQGGEDSLRRMITSIIEKHAARKPHYPNAGAGPAVNPSTLSIIGTCFLVVSVEPVRSTGVPRPR